MPHLVCFQKLAWMKIELLCTKENDLIILSAHRATLYYSKMIKKHFAQRLRFQHDLTQPGQLESASDTLPSCISAWPCSFYASI